jgi:hypothetical protein
MISKSKLGAIAFIAAMGLVPPAFAQMQTNAMGNRSIAEPSGLHVTLVADYGPSNYAPTQTGGGSGGYNHRLSTDYRLKHHPARHAGDPNK